MWKKDEVPSPGAPSPLPETPPRTPAASRPSTISGERAIIGPSISITGEVSGDEDLLIQGRIDGTVNLDQHAVTVGSEGRVKAGISGRVVVVEGAVEGDVRALEQIILRSSARVTGDVTAPRVVLEDGASFRGRVDMGEARSRAANRAGGDAAVISPAAAKPSGATPDTSAREPAKAVS